MKETEKFAVGLVCGCDWSIHYDVQNDTLCGAEPCPHCYGEYHKEHGPLFDGSKYQRRTWYCPRVLNITPDDPYQCAQVCLDCLLEKLAELGMDKALSPMEIETLRLMRKAR